MSKDNNGIRGDAYRESGWQALANAIVELAAKDLKDRCKKLRHEHDRKRLLKASEEYKFFHSEWLQALSSLDGQSIEAAIRREVWKD